MRLIRAVKHLKIKFQSLIGLYILASHFYAYLDLDLTFAELKILTRSYKAFKNDFLFEKVLTGYLSGTMALLDDVCLITTPPDA